MELLAHHLRRSVTLGRVWILDLTPSPVLLGGGPGVGAGVSAGWPNAVRGRSPRQRAKHWPRSPLCCPLNWHRNSRRVTSQPAQAAQCRIGSTLSGLQRTFHERAPFVCGLSSSEVKTLA
jgi:hypothetical protein